MTHVDTTEELPVAISTCYGIGGLEKGFERVIGRVRVACYVEIESVAVENLVCKMEAGEVDPAPIWTDLKTLPLEPFRNRIDWLFGGYPCTPFSTAGKRRGKDDPRHLWPSYERIIKAIRPVCCLFENVDDHLSLGFLEVYCSLRNMGYAVEAGIYSAEEVGAPHERKRLFIIAVDDPHSLKPDEVRRIFGKDRQASQGERGTKYGAPISRRTCSARYAELANTESNRDNRDNRELPQKNEGFEKSEEQHEDKIGKLKWSGKNDTKVDNASSGRHGEAEKEIPTGRNSIESSSGSELADTPRQRKRKQNDKKNTGSKKGTTRKISSKRSKVGDTNESRLQGRGSNVSEEHAHQSSSWSHGPCDQDTQWPARPGEQQYEWEYPRTTITDASARLLGGYSQKYPESFSQRQVDQVAIDGFTGTVIPALGLSINGYSFREDFLRALGNMVVPDTAEKAIRDLIRKHGIEI